MTSTIVAGLLAVLISPAAAGAAPTTELSASARPCATTWRAVERVAVRRPGPYDGPVVTMRTPVHHYLRKGEVVRSGGPLLHRRRGGRF